MVDQYSHLPVLTHEQAAERAKTQNQGARCTITYRTPDGRGHTVVWDMGEIQRQGNASADRPPS